MNYVSEIKVQEILEEIRFLIEKGILSLEKLKDINADIKKSLFFLGIADGKKVAGSNNIKITLEKMEYSCLRFEIKNISKNKESSFMIDPKCDEISDNLDEIKIRSVIFMEKSAEMIAIYIKQIESQLGEVENNKLSFIDKVKLLPNLIEEDANNNYQILNSTPILKEGQVSIGGILAFDGNSSEPDYLYTGGYLSFYNKYGIKVNVPLKKIVINEGEVTEINFTATEIKQVINTSIRYYSEIMSLEDQHGDNFYNETSKKLKNLIFCYPDYENTWGGYTYGDTIVIDLKNASIEGEHKEFYYQCAVGAYTHELGHIYDSQISSNSYSWFSKSDSWLQVYEQVKKVDSDGALMGTYAQENPTECFAEAVHEYFGTGNYPGIANYSSNDLKAIEIDVDGYNNLYDYMDNLLSNGG